MLVNKENVAIVNGSLVINLNNIRHIDYVNCDKDDLLGVEIRVQLEWEDCKLYCLEVGVGKFLLLERDGVVTICKGYDKDYTFWDFIGKLVNKYSISHRDLEVIMAFLGISWVGNKYSDFKFEDKLVKGILDYDFYEFYIGVLMHYNRGTLNIFIDWLYNMDLSDTFCGKYYKVVQSMVDYSWYLIYYTYYETVTTGDLAMVIKKYTNIDDIINKFNRVDKINYYVLDEYIELTDGVETYKIEI